MSAPEFDLTTDWSRHWTLDPEVIFLNHGSFGACPRPVLEYQAELRAELERQPMQFLWRRYEDRLDAARVELAAFLGADAEDLAFVPNVTTGLNAVLRSLEFVPGDELLVTDHEYNASRNILDHAAGRSGATVVPVALPFPLRSPAQVVAAILEQVTERTRLAMIDHVTSVTGLVMPLAELAGELGRRGVDLLVDGAHAPGMVPLNLSELDVPYYSGNCHKWLCAPKGAGFLYVRRDRQAPIRPAVISHGANSARKDRSRFWLEFDWTGTDDPTAWMSVPEALRFMGALLPGGWPALMARNRALALAARAMLCDTLGIPEPCPQGMIGTLATVPLQDATSRILPALDDHDLLEDRLEQEHGIIVPVRYWPRYPHRVLRISAQAYNNIEHYRKLTGAMVELCAQA